MPANAGITNLSVIPANGPVEKATVAGHRSIDAGAARRLCLAVARIHRGVGQGHPTPPLGVRFSTSPNAGIQEVIDTSGFPLPRGMADKGETLPVLHSVPSYGATW